MADEEDLRRLREVATAQGRSFGDLVREALKEKVQRLTPKPLSLGSGHSGGGHPDASEVDDIAIEPSPWRS